MGWQDILNNFKEQFQAQGPEKYSNIENPDLRYELASQRSSGLKQGVANAAGVISQNVQEDKKAAAAAAAEKKAKGYTRKYNKSGGFDFFDPDGNKVSPFEFAMANQIPLDQALQGSYDPGDQRFIEDYMAMSEDLANQRYDSKTAIQRLAQDYPNYFGMTGNGSSSYQEEVKQRGIQGAQAEYGKVGQKGFFSLSSKAVGGNKTENNLFKQFYDKLGAMQSYDDAQYIFNQIRASQDYQKLKQEQKDDLENRIGTIADSMFPGAKYRAKQTLGLF